MGDLLVYDVAPGEFDEKVLDASGERVVVVDFWAQWCAPCRVLGPILEEVVRSFEGKAVLAKVNVDENPDVAQKWDIRGIPAVKVFRDGKVVADFVGARPKPDVRRLIESVLPSRADELVREGDRLAASGSTAEARDRYTEALQAEPDHAPAALRLAEIAADAGEFEEATRLASAVPEGDDRRDAAEALLARVGFAVESNRIGGLEQARKRAESAGDDLDARFQLAVCLAGAQEYKEALETLVGIVERNRNFRDGAAKEAMLRIFAIVGETSDLANEYRPRLARALY